MAEVLARLFYLTGDPVWRARAEAVLTAFSGQPDQLSAMPTLLAAMDLLEEGACVVVAGRASDADALVQAALRSPDPAVAVTRAFGGDSLPAGHPAQGKAAESDGPVAYVCRRAVCGLAVASPSALSQAVLARP
jgi:uncharacterized protein YyaL (SSP411 family)